MQFTKAIFEYAYYSRKPQEEFILHRELFNKGVMVEELYRNKFKSKKEFYKSASDDIDYYNAKRPHRF